MYSKKINIVYLLIVLFLSNLLSAEEYKTGLIPQDLSKVPWIKKYESALPIKTLQPSIINKKYLPPVQNQHPQNSCIAFSIGYYFKTYQEAREKKWDVTSITHQCSPAFVYNHINGGSDGGAKFSDGWKVLSDLGCATWADMPYNTGNYTNWPSETAYFNGISFRTETTHYIDCSDDTGILTLKQHLADSSLAVLGIFVYDNFKNTINNFDTVYCVANISGSLLGNHVITIIGYDDNKVTNDGTGAFRLVNSWGTGWGSQGFAWISYQAVKSSVTSNQQASFADDKIGYSPSLVARFRITHSKSRSIELKCGIGSTTSPLWSKLFFDWLHPVVNYRAFPGTNIVVDLTEGASHLVSGLPNTIFLKTIDNVSDGQTGTVELFTADQLAWGTTSTTFETPNNIPDYNTPVFTQLILYSDISTFLIDGDITSDIAWAGDGNQYYVTKEIKIFNATLTVNSGAKILFRSGSGFRVSYSNSGGSLIANGTASNPVTFTSASGTNNDWKGIVFDDRSDYGGYSSSLNNCIIENAGQTNAYGVGANVYCRYTNTPSISNCTIQNSSGYELYCDHSSPGITGSTINANSTVQAIYLKSDSSPTFIQNTINGNGNSYWLYSADSDCDAILTNNTFAGNVTKTICLGTHFQISGNSFSGAANKGIEVYGGDLNSDRTWSLQTGDSNYVIINNDLLVRNLSVLTIDPGVKIKFTAGTGLRIGSTGSGREGSLSALGTQANPIIFTGSSGMSGSWKGIIFDEGSSTGGYSSSLTYCIIENAGQTNAYGVSSTIYCRYTNTPSISHCTIQNSSGYELYCDHSSPSLTGSTINANSTVQAIYLKSDSSPTFIQNTINGNGNSYWLYSADSDCDAILTNNTFAGNVTKTICLGTHFQISGNSFSGAANKGIEVYGGDLNSDRTWSLQTGDSNYVIINNDLRVRNHAVLTIDPGVTMKFTGGTGLRIGSTGSGREGSLSALGTQANPIVFTSSSGTSGSWKGIIFDEGSSTSGYSSFLTYCVIANAGQLNSYNSNAVIYFYRTNTIFLDHCIIENNAGIGLKMNISSPNLSNSQIMNNGMEGIYIEGNSNPSIGNSLTTCNDIYNNGNYDLYNKSTNNISARYNYWGSTDPNYIESRIYHKPDNPSVGEVFYNPWVDENHNIIGTPGGPPTQPIILLPTNGSEVTLSDYLVWTEGYDPYDSVFYHIQADEDSNFISPEIDTYGLTGDSDPTKVGEILDGLQLGGFRLNAVAMRLDSIPGYQNLLDDTTYYWRVEAIDDTGGVSGYANGLHYFFFNLTNSPPNAVVSGFSPSNGELVVTSNPVISWNAATDPDLSDPPQTLHYILQLDDDGEFVNNYQYQYTTNPGQNSYQVVDNLSDNTLWSYRIQTVDDQGAVSSWSSIQDFKTNFPIIFEKSVASGWNLIGLPSNVFNSFYLSLFPDAIPATLFGWNGSYYQADSLELGKGYWLRFSNAGTDTIEGLSVTSQVIDLMTGWNMISGISCDVAFTDISDPGNIIIPGTLFGFNGAYFSSDSIKQGNGYWLRTNASGQISLSCNSTTSMQLTKDVKEFMDLSSFPLLQISESSGITQTLYFDIKLDESESKLNYSLPPLPPKGAFDVRFSGDYRINELDEGIIRIQSSHYPITIDVTNLEVEEGYQYVIEAGGTQKNIKLYPLTNTLSVEINNPNVKCLKLKKMKLAPLEFAVLQNYPNPFNPTTVIKYALPAKENVEVVVYNALGQRIKTLVSYQQEAGNYSIIWDATNETGQRVGSGIYFYFVKAGKYHTIRKMLLMK